MILRRYMTRQVATTTALVLGFLVVLLLGGRMIRYFGIAAEGKLDVGLLFAIIGYNLPYFLELILPLSFFIGLMLVFGRLYVDLEMSVLNSSGVSRGRLARLMTPLILLLFFIEAGLSLYGKPWGVRNADTIWQEQSVESAFDLIRPQTFISSDDYHLYVGSMNKDKTQLQDVILVQTSSADDRNETSDTLTPDATSATDQEMANTQNNADESETNADGSLTDTAIKAVTDPVASKNDQDILRQDPIRDVVVLAKRAEQVQGDDTMNSTQLDLFQGRRYEVGADSKVYSQISFERYRISINRPPEDVVTEDNVTNQTLPVLWRTATGQTASTAPVVTQIEDATAEPQQAVSAEQMLAAKAELGYRFSMPWLIILAPMLAVPLAQVRPRQGRWIRLIPAILIYTSSALVVISLKNAVTKGNVSVISYPIVIIGFMLLALYFNWASRLHHRVRFGLNQRAHNMPHSETDESNEGGKR